MSSMTLRQYVSRGNVTTVEEAQRFDGLWWTPDQPDREVSGTLHVTPEDGIVLLLNGSLREDPDSLSGTPSSHELIVGIQSGGYRFTLQECVEDRYDAPLAGGYSTQRIVARAAYGGIIANDPSELAFSEFSLSMTHLSDWMRNVGVGSPKKQEGGYFIPYDPDRFTTTPQLEASLDGATVRFRSEPFSQSGPHSRERVKIGVNDWIEIHPSSPVPASELSARFVEPLRDFLSLATVRANSVTRFDAIVPVEAGGETYKVRVQVHLASPYRRAPDIDLFNKQVILFYASALAPDPTEHLRRWLALEREMREVCELFFGVHYDQGAFSTNRFLNVAQALESFSRVRYDPSKRALRQRLVELVERAAPLSDSIAPDKAEFAAWAVDTRNYLTHLDASNKKRIAKGDDLELLTSALLWLLRIHFLLETGFDKATCDTLLDQSAEFKVIGQATARRAPWA